MDCCQSIDPYSGSLLNWNIARERGREGGREIEGGREGERDKEKEDLHSCLANCAGHISEPDVSDNYDNDDDSSID